MWPALIERIMDDLDRHLPLTSKVFHVLLAMRQDEQHGYGLKKAIRDRTGGTIDLDPGGLYRLVARLEQDGCIASVEAPDSEDDPRRRYYALTDLGLAILRREARRLSEMTAWDDVVELANEGGSA
ncbi:MAG: PadR family transcriptional regulator [Gemmatimonadota bacterium]